MDSGHLGWTIYRVQGRGRDLSKWYWMSDRCANELYNKLNSIRRLPLSACEFPSKDFNHRVSEIYFQGLQYNERTILVSFQLQLYNCMVTVTNYSTFELQHFSNDYILAIEKLLLFYRNSWNGMLNLLYKVSPKTTFAKTM